MENVIVEHGDVQLHVEVDGDDAAPPLLMLHGITMSGRTWEWLVPDLVDRFRVLRLDFRGHGRSGPAPGAYEPADYVGDAVAVVEQVAGGPVLVVGTRSAG
jgi:pimeloyl-ACP methyl ester carboxylesterase